MKRKFGLFIFITLTVFISINTSAFDKIADSKEEIIEDLSKVLLDSFCSKKSFTMVCTNETENCKSLILRRNNTCSDNNPNALGDNMVEPDMQNWINVVYSCVGKGYLGEYRSSVKNIQGCIDGLQNFK